MKIGVVSTMSGFAWGGSEELWAGMASRALAEGHQVAAATAGWSPMASPLQALQRNGCELFPFPRQRGFQALRRRLPALSRWGDLWGHGLFRLKRWGPDVVCVNEGGAFDSVRVEHLAGLIEETGTPYVIVCQANWQENFLEDYARGWARRAYSNAYRVVFVADENWRTAERQLAATIPNGVVVCNPVAPSRMVAIPYRAAGPTSLAMVARLDVSSKGHDIAFEVLSGPQWATREWSLHLYGDGPSRKYLTELAIHFGITKRVFTHGHQADLNAIWARHHLLVMPSRAEGTPIALVEAMMCSRPAVVTAVGGNADWVTNGEHGFVAKAPTVQLFSDAMERAWRARESWQAIGEAARARALSLYDENTGARLLRLLTDAGAAARPKLVEIDSQ